MAKKSEKAEKEEKKKEEAGTVPEIPIFQNEENSPVLKIPPAKLQSILEYFDAGQEFETIAFECHEDHIETTITNTASDVMANYIGMPVDTEIVNPGYFIFDVKRIITIISKKYKNSKMLTVSWPHNAKMTIQDERGSPVEIALKSLTTMSKRIPPMNRRFTYEDRKLQFNKKVKDGDKIITEVDGDGDPVTEDALTKIVIPQSELMRAASDIDIAGTDYVILNFEVDKASSESGTWNVKGDISRTDGLECEVDGPPLNKALPKEFISVLKKLSGDIEIQGTQSKPVIGISQYLGEGDFTQEMHYNIMQNKRRE